MICGALTIFILGSALPFLWDRQYMKLVNITFYCYSFKIMICTSKFFLYQKALIRFLVHKNKSELKIYINAHSFQTIQYPLRILQLPTQIQMVIVYRKRLDFKGFLTTKVLIRFDSKKTRKKYLKAKDCHLHNINFFSKICNYHFFKTKQMQNYKHCLVCS